VAASEEEIGRDNADFRLNPWMRWLEEVDFENLWENES
jgi:hypothetical protein